MIVQGHEITKPLKLKAHSVVVGTGCGGGVAAYHIAAAGFDTIVLEEGGYFTKTDFNQREEDMWPMLYRNGGQQSTSDGLIGVMQGSCYGGGSVINCSDMVEIPEIVLSHWQQLFGTTEVTAASLADSYKRIRHDLNVKVNADRLLNRNNLLLREGADKLGWKSHVMESNRKHCVGSSYCVLGCAYDGRRGTNLTYLPWAMEKGARIYTDTRCDRLEVLGPSKYRVHATVVERGPRRARLPVTIDCERVVLAASTIHTPAILFRSGFGDKLPQLGKNLTLQPQLGVVAFFNKDADVIQWRGAPQSIAVHEFDDNTVENGLGGFRFEGVGGVLGLPQIFVPGFGLESKALAARMRQMSMTMLLVPDRPTGQVSYQWTDDGEVLPRIDYVPSEEWKARLKKGMGLLGKLLFEVGATDIGYANQAFPIVSNPDQLKMIEDFPIQPGLVSLISAHNQGTCRMGRSAVDSVVDQNLKVHGLDNVYVMDGSVMPSSASTHTMQPIMVMADRAVHRMLG